MLYNLTIRLYRVILINNKTHIQFVKDHVVKKFFKFGTISFSSVFFGNAILGRSAIFTSFLNNWPTLLPINYKIFS